jgi:hypothetical protein
MGRSLQDLRHLEKHGHGGVLYSRGVRGYCISDVCSSKRDTASGAKAVLRHQMALKELVDFSAVWTGRDQAMLGITLTIRFADPSDAEKFTQPVLLLPSQGEDMEVVSRPSRNHPTTLHFGRNPQRSYTSHQTAHAISTFTSRFTRFLRMTFIKTEN